MRRAPRFKVHLRVQISGVDTVPIGRSGDISISGLFLDIDRDVGPIGSMQRLLLSTDDGREEICVLARVVRVAAIEDFWRGRSVAGIAFQFLFVEETCEDAPHKTARPANESMAIQGLLRRLVERSSAKQVVPMRNFRGTLRTPTGEQPTALSGLSPRGMALETDYAVAEGEVIRIDLPSHAGDTRIAFEGHVVECVPVAQVKGGPQRYRVVVRFEDLASNAPRSVAGDSMDDAFNALLDAFVSLPPPSTDERSRHLSGELSRISFVSVLTLCQIERLTGVLHLASGTSAVRAYLRDGELIDAVIDGRDVPPRAALFEVLGWKEGTFEVAFDDVAREDVLQIGTAGILIDLARQIDEHSADRDTSRR